jgi:hypothetical protein
MFARAEACLRSLLEFEPFSQSIGGHRGDTLIVDRQDNDIVGDVGSNTISGGPGNDTPEAAPIQCTLHIAPKPSDGVEQIGYRGTDLLSHPSFGQRNEAGVRRRFRVAD